MIRHVDSFAHYSAAQMTRKYTYVSLNGGGIATPGRYPVGSGYAWIGNGSGGDGFGRVLDSQATWGIAAGVATAAAVSWFVPSPLFCLLDAGTPQITVGTDAQGHLRVWRGSVAGTVLGTSTLLVPGFQAWSHVEMKATIDAVAGAVDVWLNGRLAIHLTGVNTRATANSSANEFRVGGDTAAVAVTPRIADLIVYDGQAGVTGPVGDCRVECLLPTGVGNYAQYSTLVGAATQWQATSENPADDDTSYIGSATAGQISSFATADLVPTSGTVVAVAVAHTDRKDDAGNRTVAGFARLGAVDKAAAGQPVTNSYLVYQDVMETDPNNAAWTIANVNAAEFGVKEIA